MSDFFSRHTVLKWIIFIIFFPITITHFILKSNWSHNTKLAAITALGVFLISSNNAGHNRPDKASQIPPAQVMGVQTAAPPVYITVVVTATPVITLVPTKVVTPSPTTRPSPTLRPTLTAAPIPTRFPTRPPLPTIPPTQPQVQEQSNFVDTKPQSDGFTCNCGKSCGAMASCAEAMYQLNTCGCSARDGDGDGVPCESICK